MDVKTIKNNVDIVDVVSEYVELKKTGNHYRGRCPFPDHEDREPSFTVYQDTQSYCCYGCESKGDVIDFISQIKGCSFKEALEFLSGDNQTTKQGEHTNSEVRNNNVDDRKCHPRLAAFNNLPPEVKDASWNDILNSVRAEREAELEPDEFKRWEETSDKPKQTPIKPLWETAKDFLTTKIIEPEYLVSELLPVGVLGYLAGEPKTYKTFLGLDLAIAVAGGDTFIGDYECPKPRSVLFVSEEDTPKSLQERTNKIIAWKGLKAEDLKLSFLVKKGIRLDDRTGRNKLWLAIFEQQVELVVLDPLYLFHGFDENSATEMGNVISILQSLIRNNYPSLSIIVVHHFGKPSMIARRAGQRMRGSSVLHASSEVALYTKPLGSDKIGLEIEGKNLVNSDFIIQFDSDSFGLEVISKGNQKRQLTESTIREVLEELADANLRVLAEKLGFSKETVMKRLKKMKAIRKQRRKLPRGGWEYVYSVAAKGLFEGQENNE